MLRAARAEWAGLREDYKARRPNIERAVAQVATRRGLRLKFCCRGVAQNNTWLKSRPAALSLRNLIGRGRTERPPLPTPAAMAASSAAVIIQPAGEQQRFARRGQRQQVFHEMVAGAGAVDPDDGPAPKPGRDLPQARSGTSL